MESLTDFSYHRFTSSLTSTNLLCRIAIRFKFWLLQFLFTVVKKLSLKCTFILRYRNLTAHVQKWSRIRKIYSSRHKTPSESWERNLNETDLWLFQPASGWFSISKSQAYHQLQVANSKPERNIFTLKRSTW